MVLAGDQTLHPTRAVNVLVAGVLHSPLPVQSLAVPHWLRFLELGSAATDAVDLEGQATLLADWLVHQAILAEELCSQPALLVTHVDLWNLSHWAESEMKYRSPVGRHTETGSLWAKPTAYRRPQITGIMITF